MPIDQLAKEDGNNICYMLMNTVDGGRRAMSHVMKRRWEKRKTVYFF
jgi:hypothetical protein